MRILRILGVIAVLAMVAPSAQALPFEDTVEDEYPFERKECVVFDGQGIRGFQLPFDPGVVRLCDEDGDRVFDTLSFETNRIVNRGEVSAQDNDYDRGDRVEEERDVRLQLKLGAPYSPSTTTDLHTEDTRGDDQPDSVEADTGVLTYQGGVVAGFDLQDRNDDGIYESFTYYACALVVGCPDLGDVPDVGPDDVPEPRPVFVPGVGWVP
jgi:hypothetical protein